MSKKILVLGSNGQVGTALKKLIGDDDGWFFATREHADLTNKEEVKNLLNRHEWSHIINCAAYTNVALAETNPDDSYAVNTDLPATLVTHCKENQIKLIHISTDYVFGLPSSVPLKVTDQRAPVNVYGQHKYLAENYLLLSGYREGCCIIRTSWVYSNNNKSKNFYKTIRKIASETRSIEVVNDQFGSPTWANTLADSILAILKLEKFPFGVWHIANKGAPSRYEFAKEIIHFSGIMSEINPVSSREMTDGISRPDYSALDCSAFEKLIGRELPDWRAALIDCISEYRESSK